MQMFHPHWKKWLPNGKNANMATKCSDSNEQPRKEQLRKKQLPGGKNNTAAETTRPLTNTVTEPNTIPRTLQPRLNTLRPHNGNETLKTGCWNTRRGLIMFYLRVLKYIHRQRPIFSTITKTFF